MIYLKSAFAGVVAVMAAVLVTAVFVFVLLGIKSRDLPVGQAISWDPISFYRNSLVAWVCMALAFVIGFAWEYRRLLHAH